MRDDNKKCVLFIMKKERENMEKYSLDFLKNEETIRKGAYGDLKIETDKERVWIDEENTVTIESYVDEFGWDIDEESYRAV